MFRWPDKVEWKGFYMLPKLWVKDHVWANLSPSGKAVFVVVARHADEKGECCPGEERIARMAGLTEKTTRQALNDCEDMDLLRIQRYTTARGQRAKRYKLNTAQGKWIQMTHALTDSGVWQYLTPTARAVYVAMRHYGWWELDTYCDLIGEDIHPDDLKETYATRRFDICQADGGLLADFAGITTRSLHAAKVSLHKHHLIDNAGEHLADDGILVYLRPYSGNPEKPCLWYKRSHLNELTMKAAKREGRHKKKGRASDAVSTSWP